MSTWRTSGVQPEYTEYNRSTTRTTGEHGVQPEFCRRGHRSTRVVDPSACDLFNFPEIVSDKS